LGYRPLVAEAAGLCADAHAQLLHVDEAERLFVEALAEAEAVGDTRLVATLWPQWIRFLVMGRSAIAEARHADRRADALLERIGGDEEVAFEVGKARVGLLNAVGEVNEAIAVGKATLELGARLFGEGSLRVADVENIVGGIMLAARAEGADAMLRRAFAVWERGLGPDHPKIAIAIFNLAREATVRDDYVEAERLFREALARFERIDPDHPHIGATINNLAGVYDYRDEPEKALVEYRRALEHLRRTRGEEHAMTAHAYLNVGSGEMRAGDLTAARRDIEAGLRIRRAIFGEGSVKVLSAEGILLDLLVDEDDRPAARALADRILASIGDEDSLELESVFVSLAEERLLDGRAEEAVALAERGLRSHAEGDKPPYDVNFALARALAATGGDRARARALAEASMTYWSRWPRFMAPELAVGRRFLAELDEAERLRR
ncbi:MAG TPA: tetratricopeptide repeat protein, partial [Nannocystaceae bacterium]|nr:tetratricopeptide repeat protein [Nannocystaceae bacterium]